MDCQETRVDLRKTDPADRAEGQRCARLIFRLNHTMPSTKEYQTVLKELFGANLAEGSYVAAPISGACVSSMKIGKNVFINSGLLAMARGGITIEDEARIAANVQLITNNHDPYDLDILPCKPILICKSAWIGAGATILPGVRVGKHAVVGAAAVVTKDVPDYAVAVGNPAKVVKMLEKEKFQDEE